ncbi:peptidoglycan-binding domain-containing protein [Streptacidiphilus melanogenes]|uniref:peptidoglycan-binding domain-containing protein n=1 Tax=Streptacidiphilus melanogenes TaxID=411235 RepID=UPI00069353BA|nr:peptidoglycan-binding domain-containing protein [Streptacidiphilus melanogenes]
MSRKSIITKALGAAALTCAVLAGTSTSAFANTGAGYIGDGYANNSHAVWCVQDSLNWAFSHHGVNYPALSEDGVWGPKTKAAVEEFQYLFSMPDVGVMAQDGIVGKDTGQYLIEFGNPYYDGGDSQPNTSYCYGYLPSNY